MAKPSFMLKLRRYRRIAERTFLPFRLLGLPFFLVHIALGQITNVPPEPNRSKEMTPTTEIVEIKAMVKVTVELDKNRNFMAPRALGMESSISDNGLISGDVLNALRMAGVTTVRYPGGGYADNYHWSSHKLTKSLAPIQQRYGYASPGNDFGHFVGLIDRVGTTVITVNYGSNADGTGGGEPAEAAAWVAYANGAPDDTRPLGKDSTGYDWKTVGYWASLRTAQPLAADDGRNFLRIGHPQQLNVKYWEVGNEAYQNGYYGGEGTEVDLHAPYPEDARQNQKQRRKNPNLSPEAYGKALVQFAKAMKAVDGRVKIGASLDMPLASDWNIQEWSQDPITRKWEQHSSFQKAADTGPDWDRGVLKTAGKDIDFVALHWNTGSSTEASGWKDLDNAKLLAAPHDELPKIVAAMVDLFQKYCGANAQNMQMLITGLGPKSYIQVSDDLVPALFAADAYLSLIEYGAANIDWQEIHQGGFLGPQNEPGAVYFGLQMVHRLMNFNEMMVTATSSHSLLSVHAARHSDGSAGVMLINEDPKNAATVKISLSGGDLADRGTRYDFGRSNPAGGKEIQGSPISNVGNNFSVTVPPYTVTDVIIPRAK